MFLQQKFSRRVLPGPASIPALLGKSAPGGAIENSGPGADEAGSDPPSSEEHESRKNAAGVGSGSSTSTKLRLSMKDVAVEAQDTAMPESAHPVVPGREEKTSLGTKSEARRRELHPPFFAGQVKAEETFPHEDEILEWFEEEDNFSEVFTGIDEDEFYNEARTTRFISGRSSNCGARFNARRSSQIAGNEST